MPFLSSPFYAISIIRFVLFFFFFVAPRKRKTKERMLTCKNYIFKSFCRHKFKNASITGNIYAMEKTRERPARLSIMLRHNQFARSLRKQMKMKKQFSHSLAIYDVLTFISSSICIMHPTSSLLTLSYVRAAVVSVFVRGPDSDVLAVALRDVFSLNMMRCLRWHGSYQGEKRQYDNENNVARET